MDFDSVEGLSEEQINNLYRHMIEFDDKNQITSCYCRNGEGASLCGFTPYYFTGCESWCNSKGSVLKSFDDIIHCDIV